MKESKFDWKTVGILLAIFAPFAAFVIYVRMTGHCEHTGGVRSTWWSEGITGTAITKSA